MEYERAFWKSVVINRAKTQMKNYPCDVFSLPQLELELSDSYFTSLIYIKKTLVYCPELLPLITWTWKTDHSATINLTHNLIFSIKKVAFNVSMFGTWITL